jgi:diguanylate cyclase (GGDEF)-like protein
MVALLTILAVIHLAIYMALQWSVTEQLRRKAKSVSISVAGHIMADIENYKSFVEAVKARGADCEWYVDSEYFRKMTAHFATIKAAGGFAHIYTEHRIDAETTKFFLNAEPMGDSGHSPGKIDLNDAEKELVFSTEQPHAFRFTDTPWGSLLRGLSPILDRDGQMIGIVGVDLDSTVLYRYLNRLQKVLLVTYVFIIGLVAFILLRYFDSVLEAIFKDKLTGAYRKRYAETLIHDEIAAAIKGKHGLALLVLDLDHFKKINDTYGHVFGDKVLTFMSEVIKNSLRANDYFIRYGGEEFIITVPSVSEPRAMEIAERIRREIEDCEIFNEDKNTVVKITISIGVATLDDTAICAQEFINNADTALYAAKMTRNSVVAFGPQSVQMLINSGIMSDSKRLIGFMSRQDQDSQATTQAEQYGK